MRICFCIYCSKSLPCFLQFNDPVALEKKSSVQKVNCVLVDDGNKEFILKSCLKKPSGSDSDEIGKGNVKWMDLLGEELVEIREFQPSESDDSQDGDGDDDGDMNSSCKCVIQ